MIKGIPSFSLVFILYVIFFVSNSIEEKSNSNLPKSIQLVGAAVPQQHGFDGRGVKIGIIDTGIDSDHPDLYGYGPSGKVVGGYNYVNPMEKPVDSNGHGTEVAGIVAANGNFSGMAPKSKLFSYKVSSSGESVSSDYIDEAIARAIEDKVNVINISLGINKTNDAIENAVDNAVRSGIVVVVAAGNNGPDEETIGSPGSDSNAITVGASFNNITSSIVATLQVGDKQYNALPMLGVKALPKSIESKIIYGGYGKPKDLANLNVSGSILLEQRGSNIKGEKVYFSEKETNAADRGAKALIIFNNQSGIFFGELRNPNSNSKYNPRIPVISMSRDDGLKLKSIITNNLLGHLDIFYHPDYVAPFSSRGPVSPFYIKPDLVAPGVFVNTTALGGNYNLTSGTSLATPHVTGAVAILLQKYPNLDPSSLASLIVTTTDPVTNAYGSELPIDATGSGRLNVTRAFSANLIIVPYSLVYNLSYDNPSETKVLHLHSIDNSVMPQVKVSFLSNESGFAFNYSTINNVMHAEITGKLKRSGNYDAFILINDSKTVYRIPVVIHLTKGTLMVNEVEGKINISLDYPEKWSYAKISLMKAYSHTVRTTSITPQSHALLPIHDTGDYWIEADIKTGNDTDYAYKTLTVRNSVGNYIDLEDVLQIPIKQIEIISVILIITVIVGLSVRPG